MNYEYNRLSEAETLFSISPYVPEFHRVICG